MKRLPVRIEEDLHEELRILAARNNTTMSSLVRFAVDRTFEVELDAIAGQPGWEEHLRAPLSFSSWEQCELERGLDL